MSAEALYNAAQRGDVAEVRSLLAQGVDPQGHKGVYGMCALHVASSNGHVSVVRVILDAGVPVYVRDSTNYTPLHYACEQRQLQVSEVLLEHGASTTAKTKGGDTPLHKAANGGHMAIVRLLVEQYGAASQLSTTGYEGRTPAQWARYMEHSTVAEYLEQEASRYRHVSPGTSPAHQAPTHLTKHTPPLGAPIRGETTSPSPAATLAPASAQPATSSERTQGDRRKARVARPATAKVTRQVEQLSVRPKTTSTQATAAPAAAEEFDYQLGDYRLNFAQPLGGGQFGQVYRAMHKDGGEVVALKRVTWQVDTSLLPVDPKRELETCRRVPKHPNIVEMIDGILHDRQLILVTELCNGDLETHMVSLCPPMSTRVDYMYQISCGMLHLHSQSPPIVHRDLKPQNILLKQEGQKLVVKIADFGFARPVEQSLMKTLCGTPTYWAPDVLPDIETEFVEYTSQCDVFSLGLVYQAMALYKKGDHKMKPQLDVPPDPNVGLAQQVRAAQKAGLPVPGIKHIPVPPSGDYVLEYLDMLIQQMTRYEPERRLALKYVNRQLRALKDD